MSTTFDEKRIKEIREKLHAGKAEEAINLTAKYADELMNKETAVKNATQQFLARKMDADELQRICREYRDRFIREVLEQARV